MKSQIPTGCPARIFPDIEVKYLGSGYNAGNYAKDVYYFLQCCLDAGYKPGIYTGAGFLSLLNPWRIDVDYWWARYPNSLQPSKTPQTWGDLKTKLATVKFADADLIGSSHVSPGQVKLWQISGDRWILPGCAGHTMDISIWNGSLNELKTWWGMKTITPEDEPPIAVDRLPAFLQKLHELEDAWN